MLNQYRLDILVIMYYKQLLWSVAFSSKAFIESEVVKMIYELCENYSLSYEEDILYENVKKTLKDIQGKGSWKLDSPNYNHQNFDIESWFNV